MREPVPLQSWLELLCRMIPGVSQAVLLPNLSADSSIQWPPQADIHDDLMTAASLAAFIEPADEFVWLAISKDYTRLGSALSRLHSMYRRIEIQPEDGSGDSQKGFHAMKDYALPEKVTCTIIGISPRLTPLIEKFTRQLEDSLHDVDTAVGQNNFDEIRKFAGWLKAYGGTMGYGEFTEPAADLEASAKAKQIDIIEHTIGIIKEIQHRMEPLKSEHESGTDLYLAMVGK